MSRLQVYAEALVRLQERDAVYPCYCSPQELVHRRGQSRLAGRPPRYDGRCRDLSARQREACEAQGRQPTWRLRVPATGETVVHDLVRGDVVFPHAALDDFVIVRSNGVPVYNFVVAVDDADMDITHVLRGDDHLANTPKQILVYNALGACVPAFAHLPSVLASDRSRLSKRHGPVSIEEYREQGLLPEAILNYCALLGWSPGDDREVMTLQEMVEAFDLERVGKAGAVYDVEKLRWINGQHLRRLSPGALWERARPWLRAAGLTDEVASGKGPAPEAAVALVQQRVQTLAQVPEAVAYLYREPTAFDPAGVRRHFQPASAHVLGAAAEVVRGLATWDELSLETAYRALADRLGVKAAALIHPTRLALTGHTMGPSLFALAALIGRQGCVARLCDAASRIAAGEFALQG